MANIKSQMKRNRQTIVRNDRNRALRSELKTRIAAVTKAAEAGDVEKATELGRLAQRQIDVAVSKGVLKKTTAARRKSSVARTINGMSN